MRYAKATSRVGRIAMRRVTVMRSHRDRRMSRNPFITNCPVYVPVMVLL